jgi:DNA-binding XRE family transcriptional regulator
MRKTRSDAVRSFYVSVGKKISDVRRQQRMTQDALANAVSLTRTSIVNIERGKQQILFHTYLQIAQALRIEPTVLIPEGLPAAQPAQEAIARFVADPKGRAWIRNRLDKLQALRKPQH